MTARALLRWAVGFAFAILLAAAWSTPGQAHPGHSGAAAMSGGHAGLERAEPGREAAPKSGPGVARSQAADPAMAAAERDCGGHQAGADGESHACCSTACHAVMPIDLALSMIVATVLAVGPSSAEPAAHAGPAVYIKRPPRPSAA